MATTTIAVPTPAMPTAAVPTTAAPSARPTAAGRRGRAQQVPCLLLATLGLVSGVVLARQLAAVDVAGALSVARPGWVGVAVGASLLQLLGAAAVLVAFAPGRLPLGRTVAVQLASSFASVVTPPAVGQLAVSARYLHRAGHGRAAVAATAALTQVSNLVVTLVLLVVVLAVTGGGLAPGGATSAGTGAPAVVALLLVAAAAGVGAVAGPALVPALRRAALAAVRGPLQQARPVLAGVAAQPVRLLSAAGGNLLLTGGGVLALDASLRAVGAQLPLAATAVVLLAGTALGSLAPTPGGAGAVEAALTGGLVAAGVPLAAALPAVLVYRSVTLWGRVLPGWVSLVVLRRRGAL